MFQSLGPATANERSPTVTSRDRVTGDLLPAVVLPGKGVNCTRHIQYRVTQNGLFYAIFDLSNSERRMN